MQTVNTTSRNLNWISIGVCTILATTTYLTTDEYVWVPPFIALGPFILNTYIKNAVTHSCILFFSSIFVILSYNIIIGLESEINRSYITMGAIGFLIIPQNKRTLQLIAGSICGLLLLSTVFFPEWYNPFVILQPESNYVISVMFTLINFGVILFLAASFTRVKKLKEDNLLNQITLISEQKATIEESRSHLIKNNKELKRLNFRLAKQKRLLKDTQSLSNIGIWTYFAENDTVAFSQEARKIFRMKKIARYKLERWLAHFNPIDREDMQTALNAIKVSNVPFEKEYKLRFDSSEVSYIKIIGASEITEKGKTRIYGIIQDLSQVHENQNLKQEKITAQKVATEKSYFLAKMSHEIRTPINGVMNLTHLLLKSNLDENQTKYAKSIETSSDTLLMIVNDILDLSKMEAGKMCFEKKEFNIKDLVCSIYELFLHKLAERSITFEYHIQEDIPTYLIGDASRLNQILFNIIGNAIKFTPKGKIEILVSGTENKKGTLLTKIIIRDTGIGIEESKLSQIFDPFTQAENDTSNKYGGTGLGLSIVKQLVDLQNGSIAIRSKLGIGSEFEVSIPFEISSQKKEQKNIQNKAILDTDLIKDLSILIVEDNPINQMVIQDLIESVGGKVSIANNGKEGINLLENQTFDLILMDMQMPVMDGYEAMKYIRNKLGLSKDQLPIVALTAHVLKGEKEKCINTGANCYLSKPFKAEELYEAIIIQTPNKKSESI